MHAILYVYELEFVPSGVSVTISYVEDDPQGSNIFDDPKSSRSDVCEIASGSFMACVGVTRVTSEWY